MSDPVVAAPLPRSWRQGVKRAVIEAMSISAAAFNINLGRWFDSPVPQAREEAEKERLRVEVELLKEELRIKDARLARMPPGTGPRYEPADRMAILELRAQRGWTQIQTAGCFHLHPDTVGKWTATVDEKGADALTQIPVPVNKFPDVVGYLVHRLKACAPASGRKRIAQLLARQRLHVSPSTVRRRLKEQPAAPPPAPEDGQPGSAGAPAETPRRQVVAKRPGHVVNVDLTTVPTVMGQFTMLPPHALPQLWPFVWWVAFAVDHYSRRALGHAVFMRQPTSLQIRRFLGRALGRVGTAVSYTITDKGRQFWCAGFKKWCRRKKIRPRFGKVGRYGSISLIERFIGSFKVECVRRISVPLRRVEAHEEFGLWLRWNNQHRPHQALNGRTPDEVWFGRPPENEKPRLETRRNWPRDSLCAMPWAPIDGRRGARVAIEVRHFGGRKHLPVIRLTRTA
jgi:putative transposase